VVAEAASVKPARAIFARVKVADAARHRNPQPMWRSRKPSRVPLVARPTQPVAVVAAASAKAAIATFACAMVVHVRAEPRRPKDDDN
jgi:hypothetical protein